MASTCNENPNLHIFFHGAKLLKGQRSFLPRGKGFVGFCFIRNSTTSRPPTSTAWWKLTSGNEISSQKLCMKHQPIFCRKKRMGSFWQRTEKISQKGEPFWFGSLCTCKRGPKVRRTAAQYLESHKQTIRDVISDHGEVVCFVFFSNNDSKKNWDILTKRECPT